MWGDSYGWAVSAARTRSKESGAQLLRMVAQMVVDKALDEIVAMVVARMPAQRERLTGLGAGGFEGFGQQLLFDQELVGQALVDEDACRVGGGGLRAHQLAGVMPGPFGLVFAQIAAESLVAPGAVERVGNRCKGRDRLEPAGVAQRQGQRAVAAHAVAEDAQTLQVHGQLAADQGQQVVEDVAFHAPVQRPGPGGRVQVEAGAHAKVPAVGLARQARTARAGIGADQGDIEFGGQALGSGLDHEGFFGAGQAGQIEQGRDLLAHHGLGRQIDRELHGEADLGTMVLVIALGATKAGVGVFEFHGAYS
ncbi:hypothetical protein SDC9_142967 [bioreactor metagenome]|uniref:Uncharacterized protein n=1 Tax=bioreactor metagenome TaxID=1076179 RepID=A0A645E5G4_9ZZZZ